MSRINYPSNSPYSNTPQSSWAIGRYLHKEIPPDSGDTEFPLQARHTYRPDTLSFELYGTPAYYWVFCVRNPWLRADPIWSFVAGETIIVPSAAHVNSVVGN